MAQPMRQLRVGHPKHFAKHHACFGDDEVVVRSGARVCKEGGHPDMSELEETDELNKNTER